VPAGAFDVEPGGLEPQRVTSATSLPDSRSRAENVFPNWKKNAAAAAGSPR